MGLVALLVTVVLLTTGSLGVPLRFREGLEQDSLGVHIGVNWGFRSGQGCLEAGNFSDRDRVGEGYLEHHEEVSKFVRLLVEGKTLVGDRLEVVGLDDLAWLILDSNLGAVEVRQHKVDSGEGL